LEIHNINKQFKIQYCFLSHWMWDLSHTPVTVLRVQSKPDAQSHSIVSGETLVALGV